MIEPDDLATLRAEAAEALHKVQHLEGFEAEMRKLTPSPVALAATFRQLRRIHREHLVGSVGTRTSLAASEVSEATAADVAAYVAAVEKFAERFVLGAEWSAAATHEAIRRRGPILLPPTIHGVCVVTERVSVPGLELAEGERLDWESVMVLRRCLAAAIAVLSRMTPADLDDEKRELLGQAIHHLEPSRSPLDADTRERLKRRLDDVGSATTKRELRADRGAMWHHAIGYVEARLTGRTVENRESKEHRRAKRYLNAAVNGSWDAPPLDRSDDPNDAAGSTHESAEIQALSNARVASQRSGSSP